MTIYQSIADDPNYKHLLARDIPETFIVSITNPDILARLEQIVKNGAVWRKLALTQYWQLRILGGEKIPVLNSMILKQEDEYQRTPLHFYAWAGNYQAVESMLSFHEVKLDAQMVYFAALSCNDGMLNWLKNNHSSLFRGQTWASLKASHNHDFPLLSRNTDVFDWLQDNAASLLDQALFYDVIGTGNANQIEWFFTNKKPLLDNIGHELIQKELLASGFTDIIQKFTPEISSQSSALQEEIKQLIRILEKETHFFWSRSTLKNHKIKALNAVVTDLKSNHSIDDAIKKAMEDYPQATQGMISTRVADLFKKHAPAVFSKEKKATGKTDDTPPPLQPKK